MIILFIIVVQKTKDVLRKGIMTEKAADGEIPKVCRNIFTLMAKLF